MNQYDKLLTLENFELAFYRLKTAQRNLYKSIYYSDLKIFETFLQSNIQSLIKQLKTKTYKPERAHKIFIPKKNELVRPLSMLKFTDLLVYQAIANIITDASYDKIAPLYGNTIFGNIVNPSNSNNKDKIFFFQPWKKSWKKFSERSIKYFDEGYKFLSEFDIASFFDTIDHSILFQILKKSYGIEDAIIDLLQDCLENWTGDFNHKTFISKHGIPQGPLSSAFLADLYLIYLDEEITTKGKLDIKYLRYVDDIRIFSKDKKVSRKAIAALDLISRDLGLIPQGGKIFTKEVVDIKKELKVQNNKFSAINKEYLKETDGKPQKTLKAKTHRQLKKRFIDCFEQDNDVRKEDYLDKTIIGFSLFKLNKDDEIKELIISNYELLLTQFEGILFYLQKHYKNSADVLSFLNSVLTDDDILFHHLIALIFKWFPNIEFNENIFEKYISKGNRNWLVRYYMIDWLYHNNKNELFELLLVKNGGNYFIERKINDYKFISSKDNTFKKLFTIRLLKDKNDLLALQGLYLSIRNLSVFLGLELNNDYNSYVKRIKGGVLEDYIIQTLKNNYNITSPETFFNRTIWADDEIYGVLNESLLAYEKFRFSEPSIAILNLNTFNNLCFDKICERLEINKPASEFGVNLDAKIINDELPKTNRYWIEINSKRNQKTEAHPYDKYGKIRVKIDKNELIKLHGKQIESLKEICLYRKY
ncbi:RNA-directed DNA polymerase [Tenacibaculum dicentrarchi]|nr:RNA-directed DNA polymerase [Tenacibaculum dicentrarchi]